MSLIQMNWNPPSRQLRQFGAICLLVFALLGGLLYFRQTLFRIHFAAQTAHALAIALMLFGVACALTAILAPAILRPLFVGLSLIGLPIGIVISFIVLAILFYGIIMPIGFVMRLIGRDTMQRKLRPELGSYWQTREPVTDNQRYFRQS
jgi:hypothetical protein